MSSLMNFGQSTHVITRRQRFGLKNKKNKTRPYCNNKPKLGVEGGSSLRLHSGYQDRETLTDRPEAPDRLKLTIIN